MHRFNAFYGNGNTINSKKISQTWWNIQFSKHSGAERDKTLRKLKKYEGMYPWGLCSRTRVVSNTVYQFVGSKLRVEIFFKKIEVTSKKMRWNRSLRLLCTLCIGVSRKLHLHFTLYKVYTKTDFWFQKSWGIRRTSDKHWKILDFWVVEWKFTKLFMSFLEPRASFSSNFASLFRVMTHNSSVFFNLNLYLLWTIGFDQSANFQTFDCSHEN